MYVPYGLSSHHVRESVRGRVADYCPFCDQIQPFRVIERTSIGISDLILRRPPKFEVIGKCADCQAELRFDRKSFVSYSENEKDDLNELISRTNPMAESGVQAREARSQRILDGSATRSERLEAIGEAFEWLDLRVAMRRRFERPCLDLPGCLAILGIPVLWLIGILFLGVLQSIGIKTPTVLLVIPTLAPFAPLFWILLTSGEREVRRKSMPEIVALLCPLVPVYDEVVEVHEWLRQHGFSIVKVIRPEDILRASHDAL